MSAASQRSRSSAAVTPSLLPALIAGAAGALIFILQLNPWANWRDGAEFIGVASTFGIAHPTGYPLYALLSRLSVIILGWLTGAVTAANLLSALGAGATCAVMTTISLRLFVFLRLGPLPRIIRIGAALLPPAILAGIGVFVDQAIVAEVYTLNTLLAGLLILCGLISIQQAEHPRPISAENGEIRSGWWGEQPGGWRYPLLMAYLAGVATGNHLTIVLYYPALALMLLWALSPETQARFFNRKQEKRGVFTIAAPLAIFFALGITIYLLIPLRASLNPPYNWGDASTLRGFLRLVTAAEIRARPGTYFPITPFNIWGRIAADTGWIVLVLSLLGWVLAGLRCRRLGLISLAYFLFPLFFLILGLDIIDDALLPFHLWVTLGAALLGVLVAERLVSLLGPVRGRNLALTVLGLFLVFGPGWRIAANWGRYTPPAEGGAETYAQAVIASVSGTAEPTGDVEGWVFCEDNTTVFMLWDYERRLREHPDLYGIYLLLAREQWYQQELRARVPELTVPQLDRSYERLPHGAAARELIAANTDADRPLFLSPIQLPPTEVYGVLVPQGVLFRMEPPGYVPTEQDIRRHVEIMSAYAPAFQQDELPALDPQAVDHWSWKHLRIGEAWLRLGMLPAAEAEYRAAVMTAPERIETWQEMAAFYTIVGDVEGTEAALREALALEPRNEEIRVMLARALSLRGAFAEADSLLPTGRLRSVPRAEYLQVRAGIRLGFGNAAAALTDLEEATRLAPDDGEIWNDLGVVYLQRGRWEEATSSFERAVELYPGLSEAWMNLGLIATQNSEWENAAEYLRRAIEAGVNTPEAGHTLGIVRFNNGDYAGAEEALRDNLRAWPEHADSYLALGYLYEQTGRIREAIALYNAGRAAVPGDGRFAQRLRNLQPPPD